MNSVGHTSRQFAGRACVPPGVLAFLTWAIFFSAGNAHAQAGGAGPRTLELGHEYSTQGHPKAKGLTVTLQYPTGWQRAEGERPNVVQKFSEQRSDGLSRMALLLIKYLPKEIADIPEADLYGELSSMDDLAQELRDMFPPGARILSAVVTKYDGAPGLLCVYVMQGERAGFQLEMHVVQHTVFHGGKILLLECSAGGLAGSTAITSLFQESRDLFTLMGNSIVLQDKWARAYDPPARTGASSSDGSVDDAWILGLVLSLVLTWGIGLTPPLLIRFAMLRRPLSKAWAWGVAACFLFVNLVIFVAMGSQSKTHFALILVAWASYGILRAGGKNFLPTPPSSPDQSVV